VHAGGQFLKGDCGMQIILKKVLSEVKIGDLKEIS
jgi:hypothetical protein